MPPSARGATKLPGAITSVGVKLALATLLVLCLGALATYVQVSRAERSRAFTAKENTAITVGALFASAVQASVAFDDAPGVAEQVALFRRAPDVARAEVVALPPGTTASTPPRVERDASVVHVHTPVLDPMGKPLAMAHLALSLNAEYDAVARTEKRTLEIALAAALVISLLLIGLTRVLVVTRIRTLARAASQLRRGRRVAVDVRGRDEISALSRAFATMSDAILDREAQIERRNVELRRVLDNVDTGFLTVDLGGQMARERSAILDTWLGVPDSDDVGAYIARLSPVAAETLRIGLLQIADDFLPLEVALDQLPKRAQRDGRTFELAYSPVTEGDRVSAVVIAIKDVTDRVEREAAECEHRETVALFRRFVEDRVGFERFANEGKRLVDALAAPTDDIGREVLLRDAHTLKGLASVFEVESVAAACHVLEDELARRSDAGDPDAIAASTERVAAAWAKVSRLHEELGGAGARDVVLTRDEHARLLDAVQSGAPHARLAEIIRSLLLERASVVVARLARDASALARRLGRPTVDVVTSVDPPDLRLDPQVFAPVVATVPHLLRNALDHGLEPAPARVAAGKPERGVLRLAFTGRRDATELVVADDGRGVDWERVRVAAERRGLPARTHEDLCDALFADEVSTRDVESTVSGRGIGTSAVRAAVRSVGGDVHLESEPGAGAVFRLVVPTRAAPRARAA